MDFQINSTYKFNTLAPAVLGAVFSSATLIGIMNFQTACSFINPLAMQANIGPLLPSGTPSDVRKYTYYQFEFADGSKAVLAGAWIDMSSLQAVTNTSLVINIANAGDVDAAKIRTALVILGYPSITIEQLSS